MAKKPSRTNRIPVIPVALSLMFLATFAAVSAAQQSSNIGPAQGRQVTLRKQLTIGLKVFTQADKVFIDKVVTAVEQGRLPRKLVDSTFLWARGRAKRRSYARYLRPMVYFQPGLTLRAKRIGVRL
ncbi:MAG: hypothetical protein GXP24_06025 [Planctomycetes bacterium]|nr:hypothetical protein [Planctomycetota bacterium]